MRVAGDKGTQLQQGRLKGQSSCRRWGRRAQGIPTMRSILLFMIGVPLPVILLLAMCTHHF